MSAPSKPPTAEREPGKSYRRNRGAAGMSRQELHEFASTARKGLPKHSRTTSIGELMGHK